MPFSQWVYYACWLTVLTLYWVVRDLRKGIKKVPKLAATDGETEGPSVTVVLAAKDEEKKIRECLDSILASDYQNLDIVVVNDRSTDKTGEILKDYKHKRKVTVLSIETLPEGWLGKNHALWTGAKESTSDYLLFTDADVLYDPTAIRRAMAYTTKHGLDHLTILPKMIARTPLQFLAQDVMWALFMALLRPWRVTLAKSQHSMGVGAFNLLRRAAYEKIGTHEALKLHPIDDMRLGQCVKQTGLKQGVLFSGSLIKVEWYSSLKDMFHGLSKNLFAAFQFKLWAVVAFSALLVWFGVFPYLGLIASRGFTPIVCLFNVILLTRLYWVQRKISKAPPYYALGFPVGIIFFLGMIWYSVFKTLTGRGIRWRDTFYPLAELKVAVAEAVPSRKKK